MDYLPYWLYDMITAPPFLSEVLVLLPSGSRQQQYSRLGGNRCMPHHTLSDYQSVAQFSWSSCLFADGVHTDSPDVLGITSKPGTTYHSWWDSFHFNIINTIPIT